MGLLVAEDNSRMAELLRRGLTEEGYAVDVTGDGSLAIALASQRHYDAVVLDVMLPGASGFEVCASMRRAGAWAPVLMLTARDDIESRVRGLESGADDYVVKPFAFSELLARLRALIRRGSGARTEELFHEAVRLDPVGHRVWNHGYEVILAPTQFQLLELFLRHPGEAFSRARLLIEVWDVAAVARSNIVDQQVALLRRHMARQAPWDQLETLRGFGYRLRPVVD